MSDNWLDHGHGRDPSHLPPVFSRAPSGPGDAGGSAPGPTQSEQRFRGSGPWFVAIVTVVAVIGSASAAYAIRESLFPSVGAPPTQSVWQNPAPPVEPVPATTPVDDSTTTSTASTSTSSTSVPGTVGDVAGQITVPGGTSPSTSVSSGHAGGDDDDGGGDDDDSGPGTPSASVAPTTSIDDHGGGSDPDPDSGSGSGFSDDPGGSDESGSGGHGSDDSTPDDSGSDGHGSDDSSSDD